MTVVDYLGENGRGGYRRCHVKDLLPKDVGGLELVFVFESPHVAELAVGLPVVGPSGANALRLLRTDSSTGDSLGHFVERRQLAGDPRIGIMNVSNVPLQAGAFKGSEAPGLADEDWTLIERVRSSTARSVATMRGDEARKMAEGIASGFHSRVSAMTSVNSGFRMVTAGAFARRMVDALPIDLTRPPLRVPHPSFNQWNWARNQERPDLIELRGLFSQISNRSASSNAGLG